MKHFDSAAFKAGYRAACARYGIDPETGATSYQVVHVVVEQRRRAYRRSGWWQEPELWLPDPPYRSSAEKRVLRRLFWQAYHIAWKRELRRAYLPVPRVCHRRGLEPREKKQTSGGLDK